jgi:hypothetical protein
VKKRTVFLTLVGLAALVATAGCSGAGAADDVPAINGGPSTTAAAPRSVTRERVLAAGTVLDLRSGVRITSASNHAGDPVSATFASAALTPRGDTVIPVGAVLSGSITRIAESGNPRQAGTLQLAFSTLTIGSTNYPVQVTVTSLATHLDKAGVTTEDAAKVAVGAAVGGVAGRVIGGNRTGTLIGAGAGAAAGTVYATQTRDRDIVLSSGAAIGAVLADPFTRSVTTRN